MQSLNDTLDAFKLYAASGSRPEINRRMQYYHGKMSEFERDFYHTAINSDDAIKKVVREILTTLDIPRNQWGRYLTASLNVHDFFVELSLQREHNRKIDYFVGLLNQQHRLQWLKIFAGSAAALAVIEVAYPFLKTLMSAQELVTAALLMPVVGLFFTTAVALYSLYKNLYDRHTPLYQRFRDNFFLLADVALKFAAYSVLIAAATTATPVAAILFIVAECVSVLKEVVNLIQIIGKNRYHPIMSSMDNLSYKQYKARQDSDYIKHRNAILINLFTAAVCVGIVALWCFAPPSLIVTVAAIAAIGMVYFIKAQLKKCNEASIRHGLQATFDDLEKKFPGEEPETRIEGEVEAGDVSPGEGEDDALLATSPASRSSIRTLTQRLGLFGSVSTSVAINGPSGSLAPGF